MGGCETPWTHTCKAPRTVPQSTVTVEPAGPTCSTNSRTPHTCWENFVVFLITWTRVAVPRKYPDSPRNQFPHSRASLARKEATVPCHLLATVVPGSAEQNSNN